ncbi:MAG TPA: hypothetical protein VGP36_13080 [Mycobacteriales bacterium]|nr:hypothetical protein [Mycobacteriales bacterium]
MNALRLRRSAGRLAALAASLAVMTGALVGLQLAGAAPAGAVTGIHKVTGTASPSNSLPAKTASALCPVGERVIGGGGWAFPSTADADRVALTELRPVHPASGQDSYVVSAAEVTPNISSNWSVQAFAICAGPVSGLNIVSSVSNPFREVDAFCPAGQSVLGSGALVNNAGNHTRLVEATPFLAGDRVRAAAQDDGSAAVGQWTVTAYAVCAPTPAGYQVVFAPSATNQSEPEKVAFVSCPAGTRVHGAAALVASPAPGIALQVVYPFNALDKVEAFGVETQPNSFNWDVRAVAICAT